MLPLGLDLLSRTVRALPPALDPPLARAAGAAWCALDGRKRSAVGANRAALEASFQSRRPFAASVEALLNWLRLVNADAAEVRARTTFAGLEGDAGVRAACARGGAVLVAAHVGFWEWGAAAIAASGVPVVAVAGTQMSEAWSPALARAKRRLGVEVVGPDATARSLVEAMRAGALVALLVDGDVATARARQSVRGRAVELPRGPGLLAARRRAPIFAGRCERDRAPGHFVIRFERLFSGGRGVSDPHSGSKCGDLEPHDARADEVANAGVARWLERTLAEDPGRWAIFREFFPREASAAGDARATRVLEPAHAAGAACRSGAAPAESA
jgi:lauroyl/myristoyl acyltransferase